MISYCIIFETNIFIEIVICVVVDCKSDSRQRKAKVFMNFPGTKTSNGSKKWLVEISSQYNMSECVMFIALAKIPAGKRCHFSCP